MKPALLSVYVIIDPAFCPPDGCVNMAQQALAGGATLLQLRAEGLSTFDQVRLGTAIQAVADSRHVPLVVNDRVDVALAIGAAGVHVGHPDVEDMPPEIARHLLGPEAIVGVSVATPEEAQRAEQRGASYVSVGPVYGTGSKGDAGKAVGLARLAAVRAAVSVPVCAIGGITVERAAAVIRAGASGVAVISAVSQAHSPQQAAAALLREVLAASGPAVPHIRR